MPIPPIANAIPNSDIDNSISGSDLYNAVPQTVILLIARQGPANKTGKLITSNISDTERSVTPTNNWAFT